MCQNNDLCILNGRTVGDVFGAITCRRWNGCSVVDYCICSHDLVKRVIDFKVSPAYPWFSDHSAIQLNISATIKVPKKEKKDTMKKLPDAFIWDSEAEQKCKQYFSTEEFTSEMRLLDSLNPENAGEKLEHFCSLLRGSAERVGIGEKKITVIKK